MRLELTRRTDYALRAALVLARNPETTVSSSHIAARTQIPVRFTVQVMSDLVRAGLVTASIGRAGGYRLARPAGQINVLELVEAVEGDARRRTCALRGGPCGRLEPCEIHHVFVGAQEAFLAELAASSLGELAAREGGEASP